MELHDVLQRVFDLANEHVELKRKLNLPDKDGDQEALDSFHDFVVNCPWLEEEEED